MNHKTILALLFLIILSGCSWNQPDLVVDTAGFGAGGLTLLNASVTSNGCSGSLNYSACYDDIVKMQRDNGNVSRLVGGVVFAPWMDSSTSCGVSNIKSGASCNIGTVSFSQYCQVSDEHSVQAINLATSNNVTMWDGVYNFLNNSQSFSVFGRIPGWKCLINETAGNWDCHRADVNGNGDSASDATARYIYAAYLASTNPEFPTANKTLYRALGDALVADFVRYDLRYQCTNSTLGNGPICWWQASGGNSSNGGFSWGDFYYSGYNQDSILALYAAANSTGNVTYIAIAQNLTQGYLQLSNWTGAAFRVPPGRSGNIDLITVGGQANVPIADCDNTCNPDTWDSADAPRAFAWGEAQYAAANLSGIPLLNMTLYLQQWHNLALVGNNNSLPIQYHSNATFAASNQSGYFAQGLQSQALAFANQTMFEQSLRNAIGHVSGSTRTLDSTACFGTYNQAPFMRAMATGIGRTQGAFQRTDGGSAGGNGSNSYAGAINITVITPSNATVYTTNSTYFNLTVWNLNNSDVSIPGNATMWACGFTSASDTCNASGGTLNSTDNTYNSLANFQTWTFGPFNQTRNNYSWYNFTARWYWTNSSNDKWYPKENASTTTFDPHALFDISGGILRIREESGYSKTVTARNNSWNTFSMVVNQTAKTVAFYNGTANWTTTIVTNNTVDGNYMRVALGGQNGMVKMTNLTFQVPLGEAPASSSTGNSTMNVTVYFANGTIIYQQNGTTNGTNIGYNLTYQANGAYSWYIEVRSKDSFVNFSGLNYTVNVIPPVTIINYNLTDQGTFRYNLTISSPSPVLVENCIGNKSCYNFTNNKNNMLLRIGNRTKFPDQNISGKAFSVSGWMLRANNVTNSESVLMSNQRFNAGCAGGYGVGCGGWQFQYGIDFLSFNIVIDNGTLATIPHNCNINYAVNIDESRPHLLTLTSTGEFGVSPLVYLDGVNIPNTSTSGNCGHWYNSSMGGMSFGQPDITANLDIGQNNQHSGTGFNGSIADVRFFNRTLSSLEVTDMFNNGTVGTDALVFWYPFTVNLSTYDPCPSCGGSASICPNILSLYYKANITLGMYDPKTKTYNQSTILPLNNSVCGWTYKLNNTDDSTKTFTFSTNYTNANGNLTMFVNGSQFNASSSTAVLVPAGLVYFVNVSVNLTRWPVLMVEPPLNVTIVVS